MKREYIRVDGDNLTIQDRRREWKRRVRRKAGALPILHDAHVRAWSAWRVHAVGKPQADHTAHVSQWKRCSGAHAYRHAYRTDPAFNAREKQRARMRKLGRMDGSVAAYIATCLKAGKSLNKSWADLLGYTHAQLAAHLKRTLPKGATWQQFLDGELEIDHITARSSFDLNDIEDVRACWCLSNLRLLTREANRSKGSKREYLL